MCALMETVAGQALTCATQNIHNKISLHVVRLTVIELGRGRGGGLLDKKLFISEHFSIQKKTFQMSKQNSFILFFVK